MLLGQDHRVKGDKMGAPLELMPRDVHTSTPQNATPAVRSIYSNVQTLHSIPVSLLHHTTSVITIEVTSRFVFYVYHTVLLLDPHTIIHQTSPLV